MAKSNKGSPYEREICKELSLWFSEGENDDVFWRTSASGARHTQRKKQGKTTANAGGDICCLDPSGAPLTEVLHLECKRGYKAWSIMDDLDKTPSMKPQTFRQWWDKAREECEGKFPCLIFRRDRRASCITIPAELVTILTQYSGRFRGESLLCRLGEDVVWMLRLSDFFNWVDPAVFRDVLWSKYGRKATARPGVDE